MMYHCPTPGSPPYFKPPLPGGEAPTCHPSQDPYSKEGLRQTLYDGPADRAAIFGLDQMNQPGPLQSNYNTGFFYNPAPCSNPCAPRSTDICMAPSDYYWDDITPKQGANLGPLNVQPNIYNDLVLPGDKTFEPPNLYRNWEPWSTTATPVLSGCYTTWIPHTPVEVAPRQDPRYWVANKNMRQYERSLQVSAEQNPYSNFYRRQAWISLLQQNMPNRSDGYTKQVKSPGESFAAQMTQSGGIGPAVTNF